MGGGAAGGSGGVVGPAGAGGAGNGGSAGSGGTGGSSPNNGGSGGVVASVGGAAGATGGSGAWGGVGVHLVGQFGNDIVSYQPMSSVPFMLNDAVQPGDMLLAAVLCAGNTPIDAFDPGVWTRQSEVLRSSFTIRYLTWSVQSAMVAPSLPYNLGETRDCAGLIVALRCMTVSPQGCSVSLVTSVYDAEFTPPWTFSGYNATSQAEDTAVYLVGSDGCLGSTWSDDPANSYGTWQSMDDLAAFGAVNLSSGIVPDLTTSCTGNNSTDAGGAMFLLRGG
jgi:hypothetical protein